MKKVYLFKKRKYGNVFSEDYLTGEFTDRGLPSVTSNIENAKSFITKRSAYHYGELNGLDWWTGGWR